MLSSPVRTKSEHTARFYLYEVLVHCDRNENHMEGGMTGRGMKEFSRVMGMSCVLIAGLVTWVYTFAKLMESKA